VTVRLRAGLLVVALVDVVGGTQGVLVFSFTFADGKKVVLGDEAAAFAVPRAN
jgi:hypothetical protein